MQHAFKLVYDVDENGDKCDYSSGLDEWDGGSETDSESYDTEERINISSGSDTESD